MSGMVYLMKSTLSEAGKATKIGYRTKDTPQEVKDEVDNAYPNFECVLVYDLGTHTSEDTECLVKSIHQIFNVAVGNLSDAQPEYYDITLHDALLLLHSIVNLRGDPENLTGQTDWNS